LDMVVPPFHQEDPARIVELAAAEPEGGALRLVVEGPSLKRSGRVETTTFMLPLGAGGAGGAERLKQQDLLVVVEDGAAKLEEPFRPESVPGSKLRDFDFYGDDPVRITAVELPAARIAKEVFILPALLLLGLIVVL